MRAAILIRALRKTIALCSDSCPIRPAISTNTISEWETAADNLAVRFGETGAILRIGPAYPFVLDLVYSVEAALMYACTLAVLAASPLFAQQPSPVTAVVRDAVRHEVRRAVVEAVATSRTAVSTEITGAVSEAVRGEVARRVKAALDRHLAKRRAEAVK
jgi:hypothetical protein